MVAGTVHKPWTSQKKAVAVAQVETTAAAVAQLEIAAAAETVQPVPNLWRNLKAASSACVV